MKKILVLFAVVLGLITGCSTPVTPEVEEPTQVEAVGNSTDAVEEHKDGGGIEWDNN